MKRTRKSEAAETKVRIPPRECWEWGLGEERRLGKGIQAGGRKAMNGPLRVWAGGENSAP